MTVWRYRKWELDLDPTAPKARLTKITEVESCFIQRKRAKLTLPVLARRIGVSRFWLNQMELGNVNPDRLIAHWQQA